MLPLIRNHMFDLEGKAKPKTVRRRAVMLGQKNFEMLIALRRADVAGSGRPDGDVKSADNWQNELDRMVKERMPWRVSDLILKAAILRRFSILSRRPLSGLFLTHCSRTAC